MTVNKYDIINIIIVTGSMSIPGGPHVTAAIWPCIFLFIAGFCEENIVKRRLNECVV